MKLPSLPSVIACALSIGLLVVTSGCGEGGKSEPIPPATNSPPPAAAAEPVKPAAVSTTEKADPAALTPEMVATNSGMSAQERVHAIRNSTLTPAQKAQTFLAALPAQDDDGQREFARAAVKEVNDSGYKLIRDPLLDGKWNRQVLSVFMTDMLKRRNAVRIPVLLELARLDAHPLAEESRQLLRAFSGQDFGTNWAKWEQAMGTWLASNPN